MNILRKLDRIRDLIFILLLGSIILFMVYGLINRQATQIADSPVPLASGVVLELDSAAREYAGETPENKSGSKPGIKIPGYGSIAVPAGTTDINLTLLNPEGNPCYFTFELVLKDTDESLYLSKMVEPSNCIEQITLAKPLSKGEYAATIKIRTYSLENLAAMNNANVETSLIVA